ncbi:hypothetical protein ACMX2H_18820, partial [Arthrobacter sulfonylureivorans]|uniref:hypothetical protein n=1 Tax=Arthrobacter sulfonylureivorans TaxID=2486855 RepID=UPI0039E60A5F
MSPRKPRTPARPAAPAGRPEDMLPAADATRQPGPESTTAERPGAGVRITSGRVTALPAASGPDARSGTDASGPD